MILHLKPLSAKTVTASELKTGDEFKLTIHGLVWMRTNWPLNTEAACISGGCLATLRAWEKVYRHPVVYETVQLVTLEDGELFKMSAAEDEDEVYMAGDRSFTLNNHRVCMRLTGTQPGYVAHIDASIDVVKVEVVP